MSGQFNVVKFYETFAKIIAERENVYIAVSVRLKDDYIRVLPSSGSERTRYRKTYRLYKHSA